MSTSKLELSRQLSLTHGWFFKEHQSAVSVLADFASHNGWLACSAPSSTYQNLLEHGLIPDPYTDLNEHSVQWVGEKDWLYRLEFTANTDLPYNELCFDGLDTFASVYFNGKLILENENMFVAQRIPVQLANHNTLEIHFKSAWHEGITRMKASGGAQPLWNGDPSRLHVRKAQYHYGWDWGPKLLDSGIWREIRLEQFNARVKHIHVQTSLSADLAHVEILADIALQGNYTNANLRVTLCDPNGMPLEQQTMAATNQLQASFQLEQPALWYPHTLGSQPLYSVIMSLEQDGISVDYQEKIFGIRQIKIINEAIKNEFGSSFYVEINGIAMFIAGANWIPDDLMLARVSPERYHDRITAAKTANMTMLRVWGGGVYESDIFYTLCDQLGIFVWQDFMFACGIYPAHPAFLEQIQTEATQQIERLRHHPSIIIWTGNNEDYQLAYGLGLYDSNIAPDANSSFAARVIYEQLLPSLIQEFSPDSYYQAGSPFFGTDPDDQHIGDRHTWDVWGRIARPYRDYQQLGGRFVSEFGMAAAPRLETLRQVIPVSAWQLNNPSFLQHIKADDGMMRLEKYAKAISKNLSTIEDFAFATQIVQSEALNAAYRIWRRAWGNVGARACGGALVWQLNDCWQVTSWAIMDSNHGYKPAFYTVKRALEPITINLWADGAIWASNTSLEPLSATLELYGYNLHGSKIHYEAREVHLSANATTEFGIVPAQLEPTIWSVRLIKDKKILARESFFPEPYTQYTFPDAQIHIEQLDQHHLKISADKPVKAVWLETNDISDNMLDLMPNDPQILEFPSISQQLMVWWLGGKATYNLLS